MSLRKTMAGAALAACLAACGSDGSRASDDGGDADANSPGACAAITGKMFMSLDQGECGLTSNGGVVFCYWHVTFSDGGSFYWQHSDYGQTGTYACNGNTVTGTTNGGGTISGAWDPKSAQLLWAGQAYAAAR